MRAGTFGQAIAAAALVLAGAGAALAPASSAQAAETCFGQPATIVGSGTITGTPGNDVIVGSPRADVIDGNGGDDRICAEDGPDTIRLTRGWVDAGDGNDRITRSADDGGYLYVEVEGGPGSDVIELFGGVGRVRGGPGNDVFRIVASPCCFVEVYGDEGNDQIVAQGPADLFGGPGNDRLSNTSPNDEGGIRIYGDAGNDVCDGPAQSFFFANVRGCEVTSGNVQPE